MQNRAARVVFGVYDWSLNGMAIVSQLGWQIVRIEEVIILHMFFNVFTYVF